MHKYLGNGPDFLPVEYPHPSTNTENDEDGEMTGWGYVGRFWWARARVLCEMEYTI